MNELQKIHETEILGKTFAVYGDFQNPLFLARDVAEWIEHSNAAVMVETVDEDEKAEVNIVSTSSNGVAQRREMTALTEHGLYEVLFQSRKPIAKAFKKEVKKILAKLRVDGFVGAAPESSSGRVVWNGLLSNECRRAIFEALNAGLEIVVRAPDDSEERDRALERYERRLAAAPSLRISLASGLCRRFDANDEESVLEAIKSWIESREEPRMFRRSEFTRRFQRIPNKRRLEILAELVDEGYLEYYKTRDRNGRNAINWFRLVLDDEQLRIM